MEAGNDKESWIHAESMITLLLALDIHTAVPREQPRAADAPASTSTIRTHSDAKSLSTRPSNVERTLESCYLPLFTAVPRAMPSTSVGGTSSSSPRRKSRNGTGPRTNGCTRRTGRRSRRTRIQSLQSRRLDLRSGHGSVQDLRTVLMSGVGNEITHIRISWNSFSSLELASSTQYSCQLICLSR